MSLWLVSFAKQKMAVMKTYLFTVLLLIVGHILWAQKGLHVGFSGGPQIVAQLNKQDFDDPNVRYEGVTLRTAFGPSVNYHFNDGVGMGTQVLFSYQGLKYTDLAGNDYFRKITYLKFPLLFHTNSLPRRTVGGYFYLGPQFSFMLNNDGEFNGVSLKASNSFLYATYDAAHKNVTMGAVIGFGMQFHLLDGALQPYLGLRIDGDFNSAFDDDKAKDIFPTNGTGVRNATHNVAGLIETGIRYVFLKR